MPERAKRCAAEPVPADALARFRDGDEEAFGAIVAAYERRLVQFFYRLCWDRDRAEDLAQDLFLKLIRSARRYRPEGKLSTFIFRVATNLWIDRYRAARPQPRLYSLDQPLAGADRGAVASVVSGAAGPVEHAIEDEQRKRLRAALDALAEPHRIVFELAVYQQLPYAEIGQVLGIPVGTVKSRMHNSVRALRRVLGADVEAPGEAGQLRGTAG